MTKGGHDRFGSSKARRRREKDRRDPPAQKKPIGRRPASDSHQALIDHTASTRTIARELGVSVSTAIDWRNGTSVPTPARRRALEASFGIPASGWAKRRQARTSPAPAAATALAPGAPTTARLDALLEQLEAARLTPDLSPRELVGISDQILKVTAKREQQLDEAQRAAFAEARIVREHPAWKKLERALESVFERLPDTLRAELEAELERAVSE